MPTEPTKTFGVFNRGLGRLARLETFLGGRVVRSVLTAPDGLSATVGWGRRRYAQRARRVAEKRRIPFLCLEDGFLRSVGLGRDDQPLSIVVDDLGIYYDADSPSRLEASIRRPLSSVEAIRAGELVEKWRAGRVSKYNHAREFSAPLPQRYVLVIDQTRGDASIRHGRAGADSFRLMLEAALTENPESEILLKVHPEVLAGRKKGHFDLDRLSAMGDRLRILGEDCHPTTLLQRAEAIYTVTSQVGFEGLLWGRPVRTFGMPFYAGWGLTRDELDPPERRCKVPLENLVHAALVDYPRYVDPETGQRCEAERVLEWLALQRAMRERFPPTLHAVGFSPWKEPIVRDFLAGSKVKFHRSADSVPAGGTAVLWGHKPCDGTLPEGAATIRLEDGFLRSVGLGADLIRPLSWVADRCGIYYDATRPSELEELLATTDFAGDLLDRAERLRRRIVDSGITKYNVGSGGWDRPATAERVILVPGQVESDASIRYGATEISSNIGLLTAVRRENPEAYVVYKPHPDVLAGLRAGGVGEESAENLCNEIVTGVEMSRLLAAVDEVHVLTSLAGFEALTRGKRVVTYGHPFYAGWGLTEDRSPAARRTRPLPLQALIAGALILYPTYVSRTTGYYTTPERALDELLSWKSAPPERALWHRLWRMIVKTGLFER